MFRVLCVGKSPFNSLPTFRQHNTRDIFIFPRSSIDELSNARSQLFGVTFQFTNMCRQQVIARIQFLQQYSIEMLVMSPQWYQKTITVGEPRVTRKKNRAAKITPRLSWPDLGWFHRRSDWPGHRRNSSSCLNNKQPGRWPRTLRATHIYIISHTTPEHNGTPNQNFPVPLSLGPRLVQSYKLFQQQRHGRWWRVVVCVGWGVRTVFTVHANAVFQRLNNCDKRIWVNAIATPRI